MKYVARTMRESVAAKQIAIAIKQSECNILIAHVLEMLENPDEYKATCTSIRIETKALERMYKDLRHDMSIMQALENDAYIALIASDLLEQYEKHQ